MYVDTTYFVTAPHIYGVNESESDTSVYLHVKTIFIENFNSRRTKVVQSRFAATL